MNTAMLVALWALAGMGLAILAVAVVGLVRCVT